MKKKKDEKYLAQKGIQIQETCSISDAHWTTLGSTADNGQPVLCAIISARQCSSVEERLGVGLFVPVQNQ